MVKIQIDVSEEMNHDILVESAEKCFHDKRTTICSILQKYFDNKKEEKEASKW